MIAVVDYGAGNLFSVTNALDYLGIPSVLTKEPVQLERADGLILPGVGAFPDAMRMLSEQGLTSVLCRQAKQKPFLGICLGMQLMFENSDEFESCDGLSLIDGQVRRLQGGEGLKIPHMGWNELHVQNPCALSQGLEGAYVYFVHSYCAYTSAQRISAYCEYGQKVPGLVYDGSYAFGAQFHPEKSGEAGLQILKNFGALTK